VIAVHFSVTVALVRTTVGPDPQPLGRPRRKHAGVHLPTARPVRDDARFFVFIIWFWLLIIIFTDIFRAVTWVVGPRPSG